MTNAAMVVAAAALAGGAFFVGIQVGRSAQAPTGTSEPIVEPAEKLTPLLEGVPASARVPPTGDEKSPGGAKGWPRDGSTVPTGVTDASGVGPGTASTGASGAQKPFSLADATTADEVATRIVAFASTTLAEGTKGHLEFLRGLDREVVRNENLREVVRDDADAARMIYPLLKYAFTHERQAIGLFDTTLRTMVESPQTLASLDGDTIEMLIETVGMALPGAVPPEVLDRLRALAQKVLDAPADSQPEAVQRNRRKLEMLLAAWVTPVTSAQAVEKLSSIASLSPSDVAALARRLSTEDWKRVDVLTVLEKAVGGGDEQALQLLRSASPDVGMVAALDRRLVTAQSVGAHSAYWWFQYLQFSGRMTYDSSVPFVGLWLSQGGGRSEAAPGFLAKLRPGPDAAKELLLRTDLSDDARKALETIANRR